MTTTALTAGELQLAGRRRQLPELHAAVRHAPTPQDGPVETDQRLAITTGPDDNAHLPTPRRLWWLRPSTAS